MPKSSRWWTRIGRLSDLLGIAGVGGASALIGGIATRVAALSKNAPELTSVGWLVVFFLMVFGTASCILVAGFAFDRWRSVLRGAHSQPEGTNLRIRCFSDYRSPILIEHNNIWRWYVLNAQIKGIVTHTGTTEIMGSWTVLFVVFDRPIDHAVQAVVSSPDFRLPLYEVKNWGPRRAIVVFSSKLPEGELELRVKSNT